MTNSIDEHSEEHEVRIVTATLAPNDDNASELARQIAQCEHCLSFSVQTYDDLCAVNGSVRALHQVSALRELERILDDAIVIMAEAPEPIGGTPSASASASRARGQ